MSPGFGGPHECDHRCVVTHEFGNLFKCQTSGLLHVCDANCDQRLYNDRYSTICRVSKKVFPPFEEAPMDLSRKRSTDPADMLQEANPAGKRRVQDVNKTPGMMG